MKEVFAQRLQNIRKICGMSQSELAGKMKEILSSDLEKMGTASLGKIRAYTIENMAKAHVAIFEKDGR